IPGSGPAPSDRLRLRASPWHPPARRGQRRRGPSRRTWGSRSPRQSRNPPPCIPTSTGRRGTPRTEGRVVVALDRPLERLHDVAQVIAHGGLAGGGVARGQGKDDGFVLAE